jgi:elongation factor P--(R)-beta-lysine ligase
VTDWQPTATRAALERRAAMLASARAFFAERKLLEVDTPIMVNAPVTDIHIHSAEVRLRRHGGDRMFLHTSPEYAMKRLLASGSGDIYQICHVVRGRERGRQHNAEFTLIEWYRLGFTLDELMDEVQALVFTLLATPVSERRAERLSYREVFQRELSLDPFTASLEALAQACGELGFQRSAGRDELLDLLMGSRIGPALGRDQLTFVYGYPASQAALARLDPRDPAAALRFELYRGGIELANGFHELASATEQRARFEADREERKRRGLPAHAPDERLLAALEAGLPDCTGVALGFDRLVMLATGASHIDEVLSFPVERA